MSEPLDVRMSRRRLIGFGSAGAALLAAGGVTAGTMLAGRTATTAAAADGGASGRATGEIYKLQAAFHRAKTTQDLDLMMSLWAVDATLINSGDAKSPYKGTDELRRYWSNTGSFKNRRLSLVPSFKTQIRVEGGHGYLYFECHDVGDYDLSTRAIVNDTFLAGDVKRVGDRWVFFAMTAGQAPKLSADHYYFP